MCLLPFYKVYRAMVRAKVIAIRLSQPDLSQDERSLALAEYRVYSALAEGYGVEPQPAVIIAHGVSGSGKSSLSQMLVAGLPAVRIRSDVERKRLFDPDAGASGRSGLGEGIYSPQATADTYRRLLELADNISDACQAVVVDATFLEREQRRRAGNWPDPGAAVPGSSVGRGAGGPTSSGSHGDWRSRHGSVEATLAVLEAPLRAANPWMRRSRP